MQCCLCWASRMTFAGARSDALSRHKCGAFVLWTLWLLRVRLPVCLNTWTAQGCSCQELTWSHALARLQLVGPACGLDVSALVVVFGRMTDGK